MNQYPNAKTFRKSFKGITKPQLIRFDDDELYVVKFKNNRHPNITGPRVLINEMVVSEFIQLLLPSNIRGRVVEVSKEFIERTPELDKLEPGLQFGSPYIDPSRNFSFDLVGSISNSGNLPYVALIDTLFMNHDRRDENLRLSIENPDTQKKRYFFHMIDHGDILGGFDWNAGRLGEISEQEPYIYPFAEKLLDMNSDINAYEPCLTGLESIEKRALIDIMEKVPGEWGISDREREGFVDLIIKRKDKIRSVVSSYIEQLEDN